MEEGERKAEDIATGRQPWSCFDCNASRHVPVHDRAVISNLKLKIERL